MAQHFKDLVVWQKAMDLVVLVYQLSDEFPRREVYSLTDQVRRAAVSVPSNIAEGQAHFNRASLCIFSVILRALWLNSKLSFCWHTDWSIFLRCKRKMSWIGFTKSDVFSAA